jgi:NAD(P)-dependent dehydrogenase (short-subunit alcohol dehydrogenase family)
MPAEGSVVIVGGTSGIGLEIVRSYASRDADVVLTGRDAGRAEMVAKEVGGRVRGIGFDLTQPEEIAGSLRDVPEVSRLVLAAIDRDENTVRDYDFKRAIRLVTLKLVGYTEVVHALASRLRPDASILLFGGGAKDRPYPGSTTVTTVNAAVTGMVRTLTVELAPIRVNAIHPGIVGDSPYWGPKPESVLEGHRSRTPTGRLARMSDVVDAATSLLENPAANGMDLPVDGGWRLP